MNDTIIYTVPVADTQYKLPYEITVEATAVSETPFAQFLRDKVLEGYCRLM